MEGYLQRTPQGRTATELAYQQIALIKGHQQDYRGMIDHYQKLIDTFPVSYTHLTLPTILLV